jgi:hypothetical protein
MWGGISGLCHFCDVFTLCLISDLAVIWILVWLFLDQAEFWCHTSGRAWCLLADIFAALPEQCCEHQAGASRTGAVALR